MPIFCQNVNGPFYILIDDVFRDQDVISALNSFCELTLPFPITILATSRTNEYFPDKLNCEVERMDLKKPSPEEKERILVKLGKNRNELTPDLRQRMDIANQFLVLMI